MCSSLAVDSLQLRMTSKPIGASSNPPSMQRLYVKNTYLPFEEDETHEFKGHRNIAVEDLPKWVHHMTPDYRQTRKSVSRNLCGFLNTGRGGTVYLGIDDAGRVLGLHLTRFQKDHVILSIRDTLRRYLPPVENDRYSVAFVPVVDVEGDQPPREYKYDKGQRRKQHRVATDRYCWCEAECKARAHMGQIPMDYVVEVRIHPWNDDTKLHPFHLTEAGQCYLRRSASLVQLTATEVAQITRHQAAALSRRQEALLLRELRQLMKQNVTTNVTQECHCNATIDEEDEERCLKMSSVATDGSDDSGMGTCSSLLDDRCPTENRKTDDKVDSYVDSTNGRMASSCMAGSSSNENQIDRCKANTDFVSQAADTLKVTSETNISNTSVGADWGEACSQAVNDHNDIEPHFNSGVNFSVVQDSETSEVVPNVKDSSLSPVSITDSLSTSNTAEVGSTADVPPSSSGCYAASSTGDVLLLDDGPVMEMTEGCTTQDTDTGRDSETAGVEVNPRELSQETSSASTKLGLQSSSVDVQGENGDTEDVIHPSTHGTPQKMQYSLNDCGDVSCDSLCLSSDSDFNSPMKVPSDSESLRGRFCDLRSRLSDIGALPGGLHRLMRRRRRFADFYDQWRSANTVAEEPEEQVCVYGDEGSQLQSNASKTVSNDAVSFGMFQVHSMDNRMSEHGKKATKSVAVENQLPEASLEAVSMTSSYEVPVTKSHKDQSHPRFLKGEYDRHSYIDPTLTCEEAPLGSPHSSISPNQTIQHCSMSPSSHPVSAEILSHESRMSPCISEPSSLSSKGTNIYSVNQRGSSVTTTLEISNSSTEQNHVLNTIICANVSQKLSPFVVEKLRLFQKNDETARLDSDDSDDS